MSVAVDNTDLAIPTVASSSSALVVLPPAESNVCANTSIFDTDQHVSGSNNDGKTTQEKQLQLEETIVVLERTKLTQAEKVVDLQMELNDTNVKHREELFWLRLELDSTRREKEAVEDRMAQLFRDLQELIEEQQHPRKASQASFDKDKDNDIDATLEGKDIENDNANNVIVYELKNRVETYERTMEILNNQIIMVKTSSDGVVKSMKEEISDLMEEKCKIELDLLNQLAVLDHEKRDVEIQLWEHLKYNSNKNDKGESVDARADVDYIDKVEGGNNTASDNDNDSSKNGANESIKNEMQQEGGISFLTSPREESTLKNDVSFSTFSRNTANQFDPSFTSSNWSSQDSYPSPLIWRKEEGQIPVRRPYDDADDDNVDSSHDHPQQQYRTSETEFSRQERAEWEKSMDQLKLDNELLQKKIENISGDMLFSISPQMKDLQSLYDRQQYYVSDREETLSNLERISVLWDRTDETIHLLESLMSELKLFQPVLDPQVKPPSPMTTTIGNVRNEINSTNNDKSYDLSFSSNNSDDCERFLSTLESIMLVHGQVKMSLTLIELKLRNQLVSLKSDKQQQQLLGGLEPGPSTMDEETAERGETTKEAPSNVHQPEAKDDFFFQRLDKIKDEALKSVSEVEKLLAKQVEKLEKRSVRETGAIKKTLEIQINVLKQTHARHNKLEAEIAKLRRREKEREAAAKLCIVNANSGVPQAGVGCNSEHNFTAEGDTNGNSQGEQNRSGVESSVTATKTSVSNIYISKNVLLRLQNEVLLVVQRVMEKNDTIGRLNACIAEHKIREEVLKKELARGFNSKTNNNPDVEGVYSGLQLIENDIGWHS